MCEYYEAGAGQHDRLDNTRLDRFAAAKLNNADWHRYGLPPPSPSSLLTIFSLQG